MAGLVEQYHDFMASIIDETGVEIPYALFNDAKGEMVVMALHVSPEDAYRAVLAQIAQGASEAIFALDRFTKPGQGTKYADVLAGHYFRRTGPHLGPSSFRPFTIEYRHDPRVVEPISWTNPYWNKALCGELYAVAARVLDSFMEEGDA